MTSFEDGNGADSSFKLEPFDATFESDDPFLWKSHVNEIAKRIRVKSHANEITKHIRVDDEEWVEADPFLSSISKKDYNLARSTVCSKHNSGNHIGDEGRDDCGGHDRYDSSRFSPAFIDSNSWSNNPTRKSNGNCDELLHIGRTAAVERNSKDENDEVDPKLSPASSTFSFSSATTNNYISSSGSSVSYTSPTKIKYGGISTTERTSASSTKKEMKRMRQRSGGDTRYQEAGRLHPSPLSTKLILDDLLETKARYDCTLAKETIAASRGMDARGSTYPERVATSGGTNARGSIHPERVLWKLLLERQWKCALERVRLHPEEAKKGIKLPVVTAGVTAEEYLQTIEESDDVQSVLPLHLACSVRPLPPTALLKDLIDAYPEACHQCQVSTGLLPIHMAADLWPVAGFHKNHLGSRNEEGENFVTQSMPMSAGGESKEHERVETKRNSLQQHKADSVNHGDIIGMLLASYPGSISVRESVNGMTPLHIAASTTRAENAIVSPMASNVLNILLVKGSAYGVTFCKDKNGLTPHDWAWQNVDYFCPRCGKEYQTNHIRETEQLQSDDGTRCQCTQVLSVSEKCLHPLLRNEIYSHQSFLVDPTIRYEASEDFVLFDPPQKHESTASTLTKTKKLLPDSQLSRRIPEVNQKSAGYDIISPSVLDSIRECASTMNASGANITHPRNTRKKGALELDKTASLHMKIRLSELVHPDHGKKRGLGIKVKGCNNLPSPYFEVFAAHRCGMSRSFYKSYPLHGATEGTWEDAFLDLGLTHEELQNGTSGAGYVEVGIRVMHCPEKGSEIKLIGTCQVSLETLERQQQERMQLQEEIRRLKDVIGGVAMPLPEPEKHPILDGFKVTGKIQVFSLTIE